LSPSLSVSASDRGLGYLANILVGVIPPAMASRLFPWIMLPAGLAELSLALWLIVVGVNVPKWRAQAAAARGSR
jgi:hypothetical protein